MPTVKTQLTIERFPFITGLRSRREPPEGIREHLPFSLGLRRDLGLIVQPGSAELESQLRLAYEAGSVISTPVGEGSVNSPLAVELLDRIAEACGGIDGKHFLEPGCGTGFLLRGLRDRGAASVLGCEPGPQAQAGSVRYGVPIHQGFFDTLPGGRMFDAVYHFDVLEHISDPLAFLAQNVALVRPGGVVLAAGPGCQPDLEMGNVMALAHEHYNYFTAASLGALMKRCGLVDVEVRTMRYSRGIICAWGRRPTAATGHALAADQAQVDAEERLLQRFARRVHWMLPLVQQMVTQDESQGRTIGFYGAPRPLAGLLTFRRPPRQFDGDVFKHGTYFTGAACPVESPQRLREDPVDVLWVLPVHHDAAIRDYLKKEGLLASGTRVYSMLDLLNNYEGVDHVSIR